MSLDFTHGTVEIAHGSGGRASHELINTVFVPAFDSQKEFLGDDQATLARPQGRIVMATDSHVISPIFFPGGNIGSLAIHGTINDICMSGASPLSISVGFIIEEGFLLRDLKTIVDAMAKAAKNCGVQIVTGDTKVVERGGVDGIFINTTGIGVLPDHLNLSPKNIQAGDKILVNGTLGDHGITIQVAREGIKFDACLESDSQALNSLVESMTTHVPSIRCMRDPTRGGLASVLNEWAEDTPLNFLIEENKIPVKSSVSAVTELLGLDPLNIANEGKLVAICPADKAQSLLDLMKKHPQGKDAQIIGEVLSSDPTSRTGKVAMKTSIGGTRIIDWPWSDPLPRIC